MLTLTTVRNPGRAGRSEQHRPRTAQHGHTLQALARQHTEEAVKTLVVAMRFKGPQQVPAAIALLDRGWGRPAQRIESETHSTVELHLIAARLVSAELLEGQAEPPKPEAPVTIEGSVPIE